MDVHGPRYRPNRTTACTILLSRFNHRRDDLWMRGQIEIIVRGQHDHPLTIDDAFWLARTL